MTNLAGQFQSYELSRRATTTDRQVAVAVLLAATLVAAGPALLLPGRSMWTLVGLGAASVVLLEPRVGLYLLLAAVGIDTAPLDPLTSPLVEIFRPLPTVELTPIEMLALLTAVSAAAKGCLANDSAFPPAFLVSATGVFILLVLFGVWQGLSRGGDFNVAILEVRALAITVPIMFASSQLVRDRRDLQRIGLAVAAILLVMTVETFWRYLTYVRPGDYEGALEFAYSHETSLFVAFLVVLCGAWALWGPNRQQKLIALAMGILTVVVLLTMRRRAGLIAGEAGLLALLLFLLLKDRRRFMIVAPIAFLLSTVYLTAFWNNPNSLGQPARAFRTVFDSESTDTRDQESDAYRRAEKLNIWSNIRAEPVEGIGFGVAYAKPYRMQDLSSFWPFWDYLPHNTILWLWMKAGVVAFISFWFLLGSAMARLVEISKRSSDPLIIAAGASITALVTMVVLFSYVDLGLTNTRLMILFGASLGLIGTLQRLTPEKAVQPVSTGGVT
jgi:O-Antigen ligase